MFQRFYGSSELSLYAPVITVVFLCLLVFVLQVLPPKFAEGVSGILLAALVLDMASDYKGNKLLFYRIMAK
jgi:hypothetical protein